MGNQEIQQEIGREAASTDIAKLSHELTYRRYLLNNDKIRSFFKKLSIPEYLALHIIEKTEKENDIYSGKTYLQDISDKMQRSIRETSRMAKALQERGLLVWSHDGDGSDGTYVTLTEQGRSMLKEEEEALKKYYGKVIERYGRDNLVQLLTLMKQLETAMGAEAEIENTDGMEEDLIDRNDENE